MVLSNRLDNKTPRSLLQRTILYVLGFGTGALVIAAGLSFAFVSIAEGVLPASKARSGAGSDRPEMAAGQPVRVIGGASKARGGKGVSQKRPARGNEASGAGKDKAESPL